MSGYDYAYSVTPARPTGWRSAVAGFVTIVTVVAVSGISGAVVTLELIAPKSPRGDVGPDVAARPIETTGTAEHTASIVMRKAPINVQPVAQDHKQDQTIRAADAPPPAAARAQPQQASAATEQAITPDAAGKSARGVAETDLTFAKGYAQRHAVQEAATVHSADGKVAAISQLGRAAAPHKPAYARYAVSPDAHRLAVRGEATGYYNPYDFRRHEALAYGDERQPRRAEPQGFFGGLFRNN